MSDTLVFALLTLSALAVGGLAAGIGKYNGWKNRQTWAVNLAIENDELLYRMRNDYVLEKGDQLTPAEIQCFCRAFYPYGPPDFDSEADFDLVDWWEIREHWLEAVAESSNSERDDA